MRSLRLTFCDECAKTFFEAQLDFSKILPNLNSLHLGFCPDQNIGEENVHEFFYQLARCAHLQSLELEDVHLKAALPLFLLHPYLNRLRISSRHLEQGGEPSEIPGWTGEPMNGLEDFMLEGIIEFRCLLGWDHMQPFSAEVGEDFFSEQHSEFALDLPANPSRKALIQHWQILLESWIERTNSEPFGLELQEQLWQQLPAAWRQVLALSIQPEALARLP